MAKLEPQVLVEIAGCVAQIKSAMEKFPSLRALVEELMAAGERTRNPEIRMGASGEQPVRKRRKMNAAQLKANSVRMKKRWAAAKRMGKTSL